MDLKSVLAGFCLLLATSTPSSPRELELVGGVFTHTFPFGVDYDDHKHGSEVIVPQKLKYPFVSAAPGDDDLLLFLAVHDDQYRLHAWSLEDLIERRSGVRPVRSHPESWWGKSDLFSSPPPRIMAFFRGGAFLESDGGQPVLRRVSDGEEIAKGGSIRDYGHWEKHAACADSRGLVLDSGKKAFFHCLEVFSVDYNGEVFAIGYQDADRIPRVCLRIKPANEKCECEPLSEEPEFDPRFSYDGRLFATVARGGDLWDLHVYSLVYRNGEPGAAHVKKIPDVAYYDITTESFVYLGSYGWAGNQLFFKKKLRTRGDTSEQEQALKARTVNRISCTGSAESCDEPEPLRSPECVRLVAPESKEKAELVWLAADAQPCKGTLADPLDNKELALDLDIKEIVWAQPLRHEGSTFLAAEAIVRPRYSRKWNQTKWLSRILIFRVR